MTNSNAQLSNDLVHLIPGLREPAQCPHQGCTAQASLFYVIQHVNDYHSTTREEIADWLESLDTDLTLVSGRKYDEGVEVIKEGRAEQSKSRMHAQAKAVKATLASGIHYAWLDEGWDIHEWKPQTPGGKALEKALTHADPNLVSSDEEYILPKDYWKMRAEAKAAVSDALCEGFASLSASFQEFGLKIAQAQKALDEAIQKSEFHNIKESAA